MGLGAATEGEGRQQEEDEQGGLPLPEERGVEEATHEHGRGERVGDPDGRGHGEGDEELPRGKHLRGVRGGGGGRGRRGG